VSVVGIAPVPAAVRAVDPLTDADYTDAFDADTTGAEARSPEQWARATFDDAPVAMRWFLLAGWRAVLGLRFGPLRSPDHILGWHVLDRTASSVVLELRSWFLTCHLVFWTSDTRLVFSSSIRYERKIGRVVWPPVSIIHRRVVPYLLRHAIAGAVSRVHPAAPRSAAPLS
jgi:Protein of unknown function (DUF2867)